MIGNKGVRENLFRLEKQEKTGLCEEPGEKRNSKCKYSWDKTETGVLQELRESQFGWSINEPGERGREGGWRDCLQSDSGDKDVEEGQIREIFQDVWQIKARKLLGGVQKESGF